MAYIFTFANQKGGVGKTTSSSTIADAFGRINLRTLLIDTDPQCNCTSLYIKDDVENTLYDVFEKKCRLKDAIVKTKYVDIVPSSKELAGMDAKYNSKPDGNVILKQAIIEIQDDYDIIIIDTAPNLGTYLNNALIASDYVILPMKMEKFSVDGLKLLIDTVNSAKNGLNPKLQIMGVLIMAYDARTSLGVQLKESLYQYGKVYNFRVFKQEIRICQDASNAQAYGKSIFEYAPKSAASKDYIKLIQEILTIINSEQDGV